MESDKIKKYKEWKWKTKINKNKYKEFKMNHKNYK